MSSYLSSLLNEPNPTKEKQKKEDALVKSKLAAFNVKSILNDNQHSNNIKRLALNAVKQVYPNASVFK